MFKAWKVALVSLCLIATIGSGMVWAQRGDISRDATPNPAQTLCANPVCLRWQVIFTDFEFRYIEEMQQQPDGSWRGIKKYKQNGLQILQNGPAEWTNALAKFTDISNAVANGTIFTAPLNCFVPPCTCTLNPNPGPFRGDGNWRPAESPQYQANIGGRVMTVRAVARYKFKTRIVNGTCSH
jgi:hypothetical protein